MYGGRGAYPILDKNKMDDKGVISVEYDSTHDPVRRFYSVLSEIERVLKYIERDRN